MKITYTIHVDGVKLATIACQDRRWGEHLLRHAWTETAECYPEAGQLKIDRLDLGAKHYRRRYEIVLVGPPGPMPNETPLPWIKRTRRLIPA